MKPVLGVSFEDPADALRAYEMLRANFKCEFEFADLYDVEPHTPDSADMRVGFDLRNTVAAHDAFVGVTRDARAELLKHEATGIVPTVEGRHLTRPNPNEYATYCRLARLLLVEARPGEDELKRLAALRVVAVFNDQLRREGLLDLLISTNTTRKLYNALRASVPGITIESGVRTYVSGVDWSDVAYSELGAPPFRAPYS